MRSPAVLLPLVLVVACTARPADVTTQPVTTTTSTVPPAAAVDEFRTCMATAGWELSEIRVDADGMVDLSAAFAGVGVADPDLREALASCSIILWSAGLLDLSFDPELEAAVIGRLRGYAQCMRDGGIPSFPDPDPRFTGSGPAFPVESIPYAHPGFSELAETCAGVAASAAGG